ncbi:MAG: hypothetical protein WKF87_18415 [Chryseolinea sp.]
MRTTTKIVICTLISGMISIQFANAQKIDTERLQRDIAVSENVLGTLIKHQFNNERTFFALEIKGNYQPGYGITFSLPADYTTPIVFMQGSQDAAMWGGRAGQVNFSTNGEREAADATQRIKETSASEKTITLKDKVMEKRQLDLDSIRDSYNVKVIEAAKTFLIDYGDLIAQLGPHEKVIVSNQGNQPRGWVNQYFSAPKRTHLSVETLKADLTLLREGKITRAEALKRIKVINTEAVDDVAPDLELLSSIFTRLYSQDLSKTYFVGENINFERLKDFGVIYYMQLYSGYDQGDFSKRYVMPTLGLNNVDQETKDKKVKDLYPKFEQELKDNIVEYGRTVKSLKDDEVLVFQVAMTKCDGCGIPSSLEITLKGSSLKEFNIGKADKNATMGKMVVKKGSNQ